MKISKYARSWSLIIALSFFAAFPLVNSLAAEELDSALMDYLEEGESIDGMFEDPAEPFHHEVLPGVSESCTNSTEFSFEEYIAEGSGKPQGGEYEQDPTTCKDEDCVDNTNGDKVHDSNGNLTHTRDDCVIDAPGAICGKNKKGNALCCDWDKKGDGRTCECETEIKGKCKTDEACAACMLLAEAGGEPAGDCQRGVICTFKNRAKKLGKGLCDTLLSKSGKTGDGPAFDSSKCICDRVDPAANVGYNQTYCECCEKGSNHPGYAAALAAVRNADCSTPPFNKVTFFNGNNKVPCKKGEVKIGGGTCGHKFYACLFP